ncbi:AbgT family transporter [Pseudomonas sp. HK3]
MNKLLHRIEGIANRLPHPMALFIYLCVIVVVMSAIGHGAGWQAQHPATGELLTVHSLASADGLIYMLSSLVTNFMGFAPVGPVILMALAFSLAEKSGLLPALITQLTSRTPVGLLAVAVAFLGVMSSIAVDSGYVVLLPLCAAVFWAAGRHPIAGLALGFACVSGGFSANLLVGPVDAMLSGISSEALSLVADRDVSILANYYFLVVSVLVVVISCVTVNRFWVEPYLLATSPPSNQVLQPVSTLAGDSEQPAGNDERAHFGLWFYVAFVFITLLWIILTMPENAIMRNEQGSLLKGPFMASLVAMIALSVALLATAYGIEQGRFNDWAKWVKALEQGIVDIAPYLALMFVVSQFVAWFKWSALGLVLAVELAEVLQGFSISGPFAMIVLMLFTAVLNLFIGSASAKWALLAPIIIPAFFLLGIEPEAVQAAYRVADSSTNIITPLMPYFPLVLAYALKYEANFSVGRLMTIMLPYALVLLGAWGGLLALWVGFDWPLGPVVSN